jgi:serine/threonine-protein kinase
VLGQLDLASQSLFAGRYRVLRRIAAGGMGAVFEVVHLETQRRRALKVMLPELLANRQLRERFQMEARITANVDSEYIVDVFDAGIDDATGMPFLVMELLNGEDLAKVLERNGAFTPEQVVTYLRQVASALDKTHAAGIVHRDLKPENLFLTPREDGTPRLKILDFGISKVVTEASTGANATRGLGTPLYMAPEQVLAQTVSPATDLYALGLIAYTLLVGVAYWQREAETFDNPITFVVHTSKGATDSALARAAQAGQLLPPAFDAWFRRATNHDSASRFRSAAELVRELAAALGVASYAAPAFGPDSTGAVGRVAPGSSVETMIARTAPGTELDRPSTLSGGAQPKKTALWLGVGLAGLAIAGFATATLLRARSPAGSFAAEVKSSAANPVPGSASVTVGVAAPPASDSAAASPALSTESREPAPPPAASAASAAKVSAKAVSGPRKPAPAKAAAGSAPALPPIKYTRD